MFTRIGELQIEPQTGKIWFNTANTGECLVRIWTKPIKIEHNIMPMLDLVDFRIKRNDINSNSATINCLFILSRGTIQPLNVNEWQYHSDSEQIISNNIDLDDWEKLSEKAQEKFVFNDEQELQEDNAFVKWTPQMIFGTQQEAHEYVLANKHHFGKCRKDIDYEIYGVPAHGFLAGLLQKVDEKK